MSELGFTEANQANEPPRNSESTGTAKTAPIVKDQLLDASFAAHSAMHEQVNWSAGLSSGRDGEI